MEHHCYEKDDGGRYFDGWPWYVWCLMAVVLFFLVAKDYLLARKNFLLGLILTGGVLCGEYIIIKFELAKAISMGATAIAAFMVWVIIGLALENENHRARSLSELWRRTKTIRLFVSVSVVWVVVAIVAGVVVHYYTDGSVYIPGLLVATIAGPIVILGCGSLTVRSFIKVIPKNP